MSEIAGFGQLFEDAFGSKKNESSSGTTSGTEKTTTKEVRSLKIGQDAINKIIADVLGSATGMKDIFSQENVAGIFDGSTAQQLAGDLTSKIVGEIAKLLAEETVTGAGESQTTGTQQISSKAKDKGLVGQFGDAIKGLF